MLCITMPFLTDLKKKMQLDVGMELTFRLVYVIYKCRCTDKHKDVCTKKVTKSQLLYLKYSTLYNTLHIKQNISTSQFF